MVARSVVSVALLAKVTSTTERPNMVRIRPHLHIEQAAMTGLHDEPITAVSVADNTSKSGMLRPS